DMPRILYVEDEADNWDVARLNLRGKYALTRAATARETFAALREQSFAVVLMDIQLAGSDLDGIQIARVLKGKNEAPPPSYAGDLRLPDTPIIFVTAYGARYDEAELLAAGGDEVVPKPVDFAHLCFAMSRVLARKIVG